MKKIVALIVAVLILAGSFILVARIFSDTAISIKNKGYVKVKGFAKQKITSDLGIFRAQLWAEDPDLTACYERLTADKEKFEAFIEEFNFPDDKKRVTPASIEEKYKLNDRGYATDEFVKYVLSQQFEVKSNDVGKISKLSATIAELLGENVKLSVTELKFIYTKLDDLKVEMIGRATDNARERANIIAEKGKFRLGPIASVRVGIFQITPADSTRVSDYGENDTTSIDKEIKSVVEIQYFVK